MLKNILISSNPSDLIRESKEAIFDIIPELKVCDGFNQHNDYHQYDILEHILHVLDNVDNHYLLRIAALFHDIGKPNSFILDENDVGHFYGHWNESIIIFNKYIDLFNLNYDEVNLITNLIFYHDLSITEENVDTINSVFENNFNMLISLKKADILAQNPKYGNRVDDLRKYEV